MTTLGELHVHNSFRVPTGTREGQATAGLGPARHDRARRAKAGQGPARQSREARGAGARRTASASASASASSTKPDFEADTEPDTEPDIDARAVEHRRSGELARWRILYDAMFKLKPGDLITYAEMGALLDMDADVVRNWQLLHGAIRKAVDELLERHRMVLHLVRGRGHQVARPTQVIEVARQHQSRAFAEIESGNTKIKAIDLSQVDSTNARLIELTGMRFARQAVMMRQLDIRHNRLEIALGAVAITANTAVSRADHAATRVDATETELAELRSRVAELEAQQRSGG